MNLIILMITLFN